MTASNMNVFLMNQAVAQVTSGSRPNSPQTGQTIYQTDNDLQLVYDSAAHWVQVTPASANGTTSESTSSTTWTDLATVGPSVSITTGTKALVVFSATCSNSSDTDGGAMSIAVSGATTLAAPAMNMYGFKVGSGGAQVSFAMVANSVYITGLTAGVNTFKCQYEAITANTATFSQRSIYAVGIP